MIRCAVVYEAIADYRTATALADRILTKAADWIDADSLDFYREWVSQTPQNELLTWTGISRMAASRGIRVRGFLDGEPARSDEQAARRAILFIREVFENIDAIMLVRDVDDDPDRREGFQREKARNSSKTIIILAIAEPKRECWILSGFLPDGPEEVSRLQDFRRELGFNPVQRSEELAAKPTHALRNAKRVLSGLTLNDPVREGRCCTEPPIEQLVTNGGRNGLAIFLKQVECELAPLLHGE